MEKLWNLSECLYLVVAIDKNGGCREDVKNCVVQGRKVERGINTSLREKGLNMDAVRGLY